MLAYLVCMAVLLPSIGRWGDLVGRRRVFMQDSCSLSSALHSALLPLISPGW
ncbi:MAG: hypothetical protein R2932_54435 [Caldilineaceae bacterium]